MGVTLGVTATLTHVPYTALSPPDSATTGVPPRAVLSPRLSPFVTLASRAKVTGAAAWWHRHCPLSPAVSPRGDTNWVTRRQESRWVAGKPPGLVTNRHRGVPKQGMSRWGRGPWRQRGDSDTKAASCATPLSR